MGSLITHPTLELTDEFKEVVDGEYAVDLLEIYGTGGSMEREHFRENALTDSMMIFYNVSEGIIKKEETTDESHFF